MQRMAGIYANPELCSLDLGPFVLKVPMKERSEPLSSPRPAIVYDRYISNSHTEISL